MKKLSVALPKKLVTFGLIYLVLQLLVIPQGITTVNFLLGNPLSVSQMNFIFFALNFIVITVVFCDFLLQNFKVLLSSPWRLLRYAGAGLVLYYVASILLGNLILWISPDFANVNDQSIAQLTKENYTLMSIGTVLLVPVVEEMLYRGIIFGGLFPKKPILAYLVSTALFSVIHILAYIGSFAPLQLLLCFVQYLPAGLCLAWAYEKADSIWAPILIHIAVNQIGNNSMR